MFFFHLQDMLREIDLFFERFKEVITRSQYFCDPDWLKMRLSVYTDIMIEGSLVNPSSLILAITQAATKPALC